MYNTCVGIAIGEGCATAQQKAGKEVEQKAHVACVHKARLDKTHLKILCRVITINLQEIQTFNFCTEGVVCK